MEEKKEWREKRSMKRKGWQYSTLKRCLVVQYVLRHS